LLDWHRRSDVQIGAGAVRALHPRAFSTEGEGGVATHGIMDGGENNLSPHGRGYHNPEERQPGGEVLGAVDWIEHESQIGGCQFNLPSTHGYCQSAFVGHIVEGYFNETPIAGLNWAGLYMWPGEIKDGNGRRQIIIDERADEAQRTALGAILSGEECKSLSNIFSVFAYTCSEFCKTLFLPIHLEADLEGRTARVEIPGVMRSSGRPMINEFNGQPFHIALARRSGSFEFTYAEIGLGTTSVTGDMEMAFDDSWAHFCVHHFNQDGLIRDRSRLTAWLGA